MFLLPWLHTQFTLNTSSCPCCNAYHKPLISRLSLCLNYLDVPKSQITCFIIFIIFALLQHLTSVARQCPPTQSNFLLGPLRLLTRLTVRGFFAFSVFTIARISTIPSFHSSTSSPFSAFLVSRTFHLNPIMIDLLEISVAPNASPDQHLSQPIGVQVRILGSSSLLVYHKRSIPLSILRLTAYGHREQYSGC